VILAAQHYRSVSVLKFRGDTAADIFVRFVQVIVKMTMNVAGPMYDGHVWTLVPPITAANLLSVWIGPPLANLLEPHAVIVGANGTVVTYSRQADKWTLLPRLGDAELVAVVNVAETVALFARNGSRYAVGSTLTCGHITDATGSPVAISNAFADAYGTLWMITDSGALLSGVMNDCTYYATPATVAGNAATPKLMSVARMSQKFCGYGEDRVNCVVFWATGVDTSTGKPYFSYYTSTDASRSSGGLWKSHVPPHVPSSLSAALTAVASVPFGVFRLPLHHTLDAHVLQLEGGSIADGTPFVDGLPVVYSGKLHLRAANYFLSGVCAKALWLVVLCCAMFCICVGRRTCSDSTFQTSLSLGPLSFTSRRLAFRMRS
jgi:hypothetical protein